MPASALPTCERRKPAADGSLLWSMDHGCSNCYLRDAQLILCDFEDHGVTDLAPQAQGVSGSLTDAGMQAAATFRLPSWSFQDLDLSTKQERPSGQSQSDPRLGHSSEAPAPV